MSEGTTIQWANHTGGSHFGCDPVSPGCVNCYAWKLAESRLEPLFRRAYKAAGFADWETRPVWGRNATRVLSKGFWKDAVRINKMHASRGSRGRWFPSMIDWLDDMPGGIIDLEGRKLEPAAVLADFLKLIHDTPNLDWLLLTKRPENWLKRLTAVWDEFHWEDYPGVEHEGSVTRFLRRWLSGEPPSNVWIGTSVEDQQRADERIPELLKIPAAVRFLSVEPLLGAVDLKIDNHCNETSCSCAKIDWVIVGGESGAQARPCNVEWIRGVVKQCQSAGVACFVKQVGTRPVCDCSMAVESFSSNCCEHFPFPIRHPKGGDMAEWPEDLRVREFPKIDQGSTESRPTQKGGV